MCFIFKMHFLIKLLCLTLYLPTIKSDCLIKFNNDEEIVPKFEKPIGKFKIKVPIRQDENVSYIRIYNMESVIGSCETYFSPISYTLRVDTVYHYNRMHHSSYETINKLISNKTSIVLDCYEGKLFFNKQQLDEQMFSCAEKKWNIFSTKQPYSWCQKTANSSTFLFATQNLNNESAILAAFCYNMDQLSLQTFVYNKTGLQNDYFSKSSSVSANGEATNEILDENLWNFKTIAVSELCNNALQEALNKMAKTNPWLHLAAYEVSLIVQEDLWVKYFEGYEGILNVIWWRPLRLGNWKRFQKTLTHYTQNNSYELYVGTSGVAQYPSDNECYKEQSLELKLDFQNETVAAYIWMFLKSNDQSNKDFVIVGYNSPFAEYFTMEKVIFCPDICKEIPWLQEVSSTFRFTYAGIMFCCSTDFIRQTQYLQGFPMDALRPQDTVTTTAEMEAL